VSISYDTLKRLYAGRTVLDPNTDIAQMLVGMRTKFGKAYPEHFAAVLKAGVSTTMQKAINTLLVKMKRGSELIEIFVGVNKRLPTDNEMAEFAPLFAQINTEVWAINEVIDQDFDLKNKLRQVIPEFSAINDRMRSATKRFSARVKEAQETQGGIKNLVGGGLETSKMALEGIAGSQATMPTKFGGATATTAAMALLGPLGAFVPIATLVGTALNPMIQGIKAKREKQRKAQKEAFSKFDFDKYNFDK
jgi:hypothetical protein